MAKVKNCFVCGPPWRVSALWICPACRDAGWRLCRWCGAPILERAEGTVYDGDRLVHDVCLTEILDLVLPALGGSS